MLHHQAVQPGKGTINKTDLSFIGQDNSSIIGEEVTNSTFQTKGIVPKSHFGMTSGVQL